MTKANDENPLTCSVDKLRSMIAVLSAGATERLDCYWVYGDDSGFNYCLECCEAKVEEIKSKRRKADVQVDGGWCTEHDSPPSCETCGMGLRGSLTNYGVDQELEHFIEYWPAAEDKDSWSMLGDALDNLPGDDKRWKVVRKMVVAAYRERDRLADEQAKLAATPGMTAARSSFLDVMVARAAQVFHLPSFKLWDDLHRWLSLPYKVRSPRSGEPKQPVRALEKRLLKEAERFAEELGYAWGGWKCIKAPYGEYFWPFIIQIEQYKLWRPQAFCEGEAYMLHPCPSGNPEWPHSRDANPYPEGSEQHDQWDSGFISAVKARSE